MTASTNWQTTGSPTSAALTMTSSLETERSAGSAVNGGADGTAGSIIEGMPVGSSNGSSAGEGSGLSRAEDKGSSVTSVAGKSVASATWLVESDDGSGLGLPAVTATVGLTGWLGPSDWALVGFDNGSAGIMRAMSRRTTAERARSVDRVRWDRGRRDGGVASAERTGYLHMPVADRREQDEVRTLRLHATVRGPRLRTVMGNLTTEGQVLSAVSARTEGMSIGGTNVALFWSGTSERGDRTLWLVRTTERDRQRAVDRSGTRIALSSLRAPVGQPLLWNAASQIRKRETASPQGPDSFWLRLDGTRHKHGLVAPGASGGGLSDLPMRYAVGRVHGIVVAGAAPFDVPGLVDTCENLNQMATGWFRNDGERGRISGGPAPERLRRMSRRRPIRSVLRIVVGRTSTTQPCHPSMVGFDHETIGRLRRILVGWLGQGPTSDHAPVIETGENAAIP